MEEKLKYRFKNMAPEKKLELSQKLYYSARDLKKAALAQFHPEWNVQKIENEVRNCFIYART
ncbi:MAG: hypothetical protein KJ799_11795 [Bacteroidetes bacterium]|nr:hypothetical protein [Bacteroidota bacterium]MBU2507388.1 hypothetical protein [Bacteroidota bacterium]